MSLTRAFTIYQKDSLLTIYPFYTNLLMNFVINQGMIDILVDAVIFSRFLN